MPILFNNDSANEIKPEQETTQSSMPSTTKNETPVVISKEEDFAIFPQWDVVPPTSIINPRLKKKI